MGKILMVNGSPRAPKSNSKQYLQLFQSYWKHPEISVSITSKNHGQIWDLASEADVYKRQVSSCWENDKSSIKIINRRGSAAIWSTN